MTLPINGGLACPKCDSRETFVKDSRPVDSGLYLRRRRVCEACDHRFSTREAPHDFRRGCEDRAIFVQEGTWALVAPDGRVVRLSPGALGPALLDAMMGEKG